MEPVPETPDYEDEKQERFEESTVALILEQLGMPRKAVRGLRSSLESRFGTAWFNEEGHIEHSVFTHREFSYNFADIMFSPSKSPLLKHWARLKEEGELSKEGNILVFKLAKHGRMLLMDVDVQEAFSDLPYIYLGRTDLPVCFPFTDFFTCCYGTPLAPEERL